MLHSLKHPPRNGESKVTPVDFTLLRHLVGGGKEDIQAKFLVEYRGYKHYIAYRPSMKGYTLVEASSFASPAGEHIIRRFMNLTDSMLYGDILPLRIVYWKKAGLALDALHLILDNEELFDKYPKAIGKYYQSSPIFAALIIQNT